MARKAPPKAVQQGVGRMQLRFLGGAGNVTGAKVLVEHEGRRLLVDCGLFQGLKQLRLRNWSSLPVPSGSIDAVVLTHAHIDHSGFLPRLVELGFKGPVYVSAATADLCRLLLPEAGRLQEEEARFANLHGYSKHAPAMPLYTESAAQRALEQLHVCAFDEELEPVPGFRLHLRPAGHVLGAASVHLRCGGHSMLFSGDLGSRDDLLMRPPATPEAADYLVVESTYGHHKHSVPDAMARLARLVSRTAARGGVAHSCCCARSGN
jgi:metallo-beta-lactamase family protein